MQLLAQIPQGGLPNLDLDADTVYFCADKGANTYVGSVPKTGGTITVLAPQQFAARRVKVADGICLLLDGIRP